MKTLSALSDRYRELLPPAEFSKFLAISGQPLRKSIRLNNLKITPAVFFRHLQKYYPDWRLEPVPWCPTGYYLERTDRATPLGITPEHQAGWFYVQEAASMLPAMLLAPKKTDLILDLAAAPGSKTTQLAAMLNNEGLIVANELSRARLNKLENNIERLGVCNTLITCGHGAKFADLCANTFDKILLDAPCSGEGYLRKSSKILERWSLRQIHILAQTQKRLLSAAFQALKVHGELIYSTCTLAPEENEEVIAHLLTLYPGIIEIMDLPPLLKQLTRQNNIKCQGVTDFQGKKYPQEMAKTLRLWPHLFNSEGFFICKLKKLRKTPGRKPPDTFSPPNVQILGTKEHKSFCIFLKKTFGAEIQLPKTGQLVKKDKKYYLQPHHSGSISQKIPVNVPGLKVAQLDQAASRYNLTPAAVSLWGGGFKKQIYHCTEKEKNDYQQGKDLLFRPQAELINGIIALCYNNVVLGKGLLQHDKIKNQLPRELRIKGF